MASIIKSNTYADFNGREILTANNDGALTTQKINYPMFSVYKNSAQAISDNTTTKVQFDAENFDTSNAFDSTTNHRYTIPTGYGGKWKFEVQLAPEDGEGKLYQTAVSIRKNGSVFVSNEFRWEMGSASFAFYRIPQHVNLLTEVSAGDYFEVYIYGNTSDGGTFNFDNGSSPYYSYFQGYRIGV